MEDRTTSPVQQTMMSFWKVAEPRSQPPTASDIYSRDAFHFDVFNFLQKLMISNSSDDFSQLVFIAARLEENIQVGVRMKFSLNFPFNQ